MLSSRSTQALPTRRAHRSRDAAIVAAVVVVGVVFAVIAIRESSPRTHLVAIEKTGVSGAMVLVMNFNVTIHAAGPIPSQGLQLVVVSLNNGSVYHEAVYLNSEPINASTDLMWPVGVVISPWALTSTYFSYYFLLNVSGTQVDSRTVT